MKSMWSGALMALLMCQCNEVVDPIIIDVPVPPPLVVNEASIGQRNINLQLSAVPSFSDEEGSGYFVDLAGRVLRLRADGSRAALEAHPANRVLPGEATGIWAVGPHSALVATTRGLFVASAGWLIEPTFRNQITGTSLQVVMSNDSSAWISDGKKLMHLVRGELQELQEAGASILNVTSLAVGETPDSTQGVWFVRDGIVSFASQRSATVFEIASVPLTKSTLAGGVTHVASIPETRNTLGEVWLATPTKLIRFRGNKFDVFSNEFAVKQLMSAGQTLFMQSGDSLFSYVSTKEGAVAFSKHKLPPMTLLATNPSGEVWARNGTQTVVLAPQTIRVFPLTENESLSDGLVPIEVSIERNNVEVTSLSTDGGFVDAGVSTEFEWRIDEEAFKKTPPNSEKMGTGLLQSQRLTALNGRDIFGAPKTVVLSSLTPGAHTLEIQSGTHKRQLNFRYVPFGAVDVSYAQDVDPIFKARCFMCHGTEGPGRPLITQEQRQTNGAAISHQVKQGLMPPGSPLDASQVALISRWVSGGQKP